MASLHHLAEDDTDCWASVVIQMKKKGLTAVSAFRCMDHDKSGTVGARELLGWAKHTGVKMNANEAATMCKDMSGRTNGEFVFAKFAQAVASHQKVL